MKKIKLFDLTKNVFEIGQISKLARAGNCKLPSFSALHRFQHDAILKFKKKMYSASFTYFLHRVPLPLEELDQDIWKVLVRGAADGTRLQKEREHQFIEDDANQGPGKGTPGHLSQLRFVHTALPK